MEDHFWKRYRLLEDSFLGEYRRGSYAKVMRGIDQETGRTVAIKIVKKSNLTEQEHIMLEREIYIMRSVSHPNIVDLYDSHEDTSFFYLVLEYLSGGELFDEILEKEIYNEAEARAIMDPLIDAVRYLHDCGIVHRDIKPQNCVYSSKKNSRVLKLIDFGISQMVTNEMRLMSTVVGSPLYMAPEILNGCKYDQQVDWWSVGVILHVLLCGYPPFVGTTEEELKKQIATLELKFPDQDWGNVSEEGKDFVQKLLIPDPTARIGFAEIVRHPWMLSTGSNDLSKARNNIKRFKTKIRQIKNALRALRLMRGFSQKGEK